MGNGGRRLFWFVWVLVGLTGCSLSDLLDRAPAQPPPTPALPVVTPVPTREPLATPTPWIVPSRTPTSSRTPSLTPSNTPSPTMTVTPAVNAQVMAGRDGLRLRDAPGTGALVQAQLDAFSPLTIIGRTADNAWLQVVTADGAQGWVAAPYLAITADLAAIPITAEVSLPTGQPVALAAVEVGIVSGVTSRSRQIFLEGQGLGRRANVFTTVGDSITDAYYFLHPFADGTYDLADYDNLAAVLGYFSGGVVRGVSPFANRSVASFGGWDTSDVLTPGLLPGHAAADSCLPDETPLACEYRVALPAVALIMFGTNDINTLSYDAFHANLTQIVETSIRMGVIPVLSTIPNQAGREADVLRYNQAIVGIARSHDTPLWDYWSALRWLPNAGLADDGIHPSVPPGQSYACAVFTPDNLAYGFTVRNLTALQVLDVIWRQVLY